MPDPTEKSSLDRIAAEAAVPGDAAVPAEPAVTMSPLALLLTGHLIPDGEVVLMLLKPSLLFIPITSMMWLGVAAVIAVAARVFEGKLPGQPAGYWNIALLMAAGRLMWATLQWMGRYYILTDLRILTLSGVFQTTVFQCQLRKVARVRMLRSFRDQLLLVGNMEIIPQDENLPIGVWQTVSKPRDIKERLQRAVAKAKSCGRGG